MSTTFRVKSEPRAEVVPEGITPMATHIDTGVEVPYTSYRSEKVRPYTADHYELGDLWDDPRGGFEEEVNLIEEYLQQKVAKRELDDSLPAIKNEIKSIEKMNNVDKETRKSIRLGVLASYIRFMTDKRNIIKYAY